MQKLNNLSNMSNMTTTTLGFLLLNFRSHVLDRMAGQCFVGSDWHSCGERGDSPWQAGNHAHQSGDFYQKDGIQKPLITPYERILTGLLRGLLTFDFLVGGSSKCVDRERQDFWCITVDGALCSFGSFCCAAGIGLQYFGDI